MTEQEMEQEIVEKGLTAPRVTQERIDSLIVGASYIMMPSQKVMVCELELVNGFTVRGESATVSPENFDLELGRKYSYADARNKVWELEGYLLQQRLYEEDAKVEFIAEACHEINRAYCEALGDYSQVPWCEAGDWQKDSARAGVAMHLDNPMAAAQASHQAWYEHKEREGWVYGETKDPAKKTHPCMVPFEELPVSQQAKDYIFKAVVNVLSNWRTY